MANGQNGSGAEDLLATTAHAAGGNPFIGDRILLSIPWDKLPGILKNLEDMNWIPHSYTIGGAEHKKKIKKIAETLAKEI